MLVPPAIYFSRYCSGLDLNQALAHDLSPDEQDTDIEQIALALVRQFTIPSTPKSKPWSS